MANRSGQASETREPSLSTPSKPTEETIKKRDDIEDYDTEIEEVAKKRRVVLEDSDTEKDQETKDNTVEFAEKKSRKNYPYLNIMALSKEEISKYFHLPIDHAAKELKGGLTVLKNAADNEGPTVDDYTEVIITRLKEERRRVQENPDYKFAPSTKKLRRQNFKAIYKRKKELNLVLATTSEARPLDSITKEEIVQYFHLPISEAASKLNVGLSVFKKCCRDMGFKRWPNRTLNSLDSLINTLQVENGGATVDDHNKQIITSLKEEKMRVQEDPDYKLTPTTKKIRQRNFKARYKRRKHLNLDANTKIDATPLDVIYPTDNTDSEEIDGDYGIDNDSLE
ncbi:Protein RKD1 [Artemisia annua]|uniref:Protein RKD1 n=1 Tax=Artemisia annua TaxID=35608 RepID=A0A2U1PS61_ARTAN|nr:Protein RKD1 [Artemisia annua]